MAKTGSLPNNHKCIAAPVAEASATGIIDRAENSNNNNSIANNTAAKGLPKIAAIPAQAPALNIIFLSGDVMCITCPVTEPNAPPVAIIGPSAPNGPPVPMEMAAEMGFNNVIRGGMRLSSMIIFSIASGIPCPRMAFDPNRAIMPTITLPIMGIEITINPK